MKVTVQSVVSFTPPQRSIALSLYFMVMWWAEGCRLT